MFANMSKTDPLLQPDWGFIGFAAAAFFLIGLLLLQLRQAASDRKASRYHCEAIRIDQLDSCEYVVEMPFAEVPGGDYMCVIGTPLAHSSKDFRRRILILAKHEAQCYTLLKTFEQSFRKDENNALVAL